MEHRFVTVSILTTIALMSFMPEVLAGQAAAAPKTAWTPSRTPDGQPDLQGTWSNGTPTPLERPSKFAGKDTLTDEELAEVATRAARKRDERDSRDKAAGAIADVSRAYNAFWSAEPGRPIRRTSLIVDPPDGRLPSLTSGALKRYAAWAEAMGKSGRATAPGWEKNSQKSEEDVEDGSQGGVDGRGGRADNPEDRNLSERCISTGLPKLPGGVNNNVQIVQTTGYVAIELEMVHHVRIIPLDGRPHVPQRLRQWMGDSRGHWEGNTLVIDTTNFTDKMPFRGAFDGLHLVERLTRVDADTINYEVTVDDPETFARSWTAVFPLTMLSAGTDPVPELFEFACHEGNYGLADILRGARAEEKAAARAANPGLR